MTTISDFLHDWQISAFGDKAGTDDKLYELQTPND